MVVEDIVKPSIYTEYPEIYDLIYGGTSDKKVLDFLFWLFEYIQISKTDSKILDMGSGTGRILIPMTKYGYNIEGMEPYEGMIRQTQNKAQQAEVKTSIKQGGFDTIDEINRYDLIISIDGSFAYLNDIEDYEKSFKRIKTALKPGGHLMIDIMNFYSIIKRYQFPEPRNLTFDNKNVFVTTKHDIDFINDKWVHKSTIFVKDKEGWTRYVDNHRLSMISRNELRLYAKSSGFDEILSFSSYNDRPNTSENGTRIIMIFQKPK